MAVAWLIRAELGIRFVFTELGDGGTGGFDHHANQRDHHMRKATLFQAA